MDVPSYRYTKDIKPEDIENKPSPQQDKKEKRKNWWHYNGKKLLVIALFVAIVGYLVIDVVTNEQPDFTIGVLAPYTLPEELLLKLEGQIAPLVGDLNGDGKVMVRVDVYTVDPATTDAYQQMAGITKLTAAVDVGDPVVYLVAPQLMEEYVLNYGLFSGRNGEIMPAGTDLFSISVAFSQLEAFDGVDLGFASIDGDVLDGHALLADYRLGVRSIRDTKLANDKGGPERWEMGWQLYDALLQGLSTSLAGR